MPSVPSGEKDAPPPSAAASWAQGNASLQMACRAVLSSERRWRYSMYAFAAS
jgi:hypothetical protein